MIKLGRSGDTIVEVLIAMAIVGFVLSGAFVAVNRDANTSLRVQERSQAIKLVETQLERLKGVASLPAQDIFNTATPGVFCLDSSLARQNFSLAIVPGLDADNLIAIPGGNYPINCVVDSGGSPHDSTSQSMPFSVSIERATTDSNTFTARTRWERAGGGREEISITYRLYE